MTGALVHSACNELARQAFKAAGRNYHAEKLAAERERMRLYYIALYAEMERCRVAQTPMLIGMEYGIPAAPRGVAVGRGKTNAPEGTAGAPAAAPRGEE